MRNRIMILCTFCAIAIFSSAQEKYSIKGIANEELNNQLLYLCLMGEGDGKNAKEVVLDSTTVEKESSLFPVYIRCRILQLSRIWMEKPIR
ncbi:hypothetical protein [Candidatus Bacteroides intestinigallinarum]|uniref:hypothetical protein n=1 Tax=Candidatus Bacteroides intestinigallinarum TaxID=2838470 RepID=UPI002165E4DD|nr:hypothetical protein [Candidatus Bacteroides intestinigallinarum]MCS3201400.1 hypothetical protein [Candidatus Bacteroides intestinigallinarum]